MHLKIGTTLQGGEFKIEKVLGQGGYGITYLAHQHSLNRSVAVKEFFMSDYCQRSHDDGCTVSVPTIANREQVEKSKQRFLREAQFTARLIHPHIVTIYCIFEENGTIYYVMEFLCGGSLFALANGAPLSESKAVDYTRQIASALSLMHSHEQTHLDVKPGNIMLRDDKNAVLIDFGLTKQFEDGHQLTSTHMAFTPNYAPLEQHKGVKEFLPTIDVYALGATLYFLLTGKNPPMADEVFNDGLPDLPSNVSSCTRRAVEMAMQPKSKDRPQSMKAFIDMLPSSATSEQTTPSAPQAPKTQVRPNLDISKVDVSKLKKSHSYNQKPQYNDEAKTALISDKKPSIRKKSQNKLMMIIGAIVLVVIVTLLLNLQNFKSNNSSLLSEADVTEETETISEVKGETNVIEDCLNYCMTTYVIGESMSKYVTNLEECNINNVYSVPNSDNDEINITLLSDLPYFNYNANNTKAINANSKLKEIEFWFKELDGYDAFEISEKIDNQVADILESKGFKKGEAECYRDVFVKDDVRIMTALTHDCGYTITISKKEI